MNRGSGQERVVLRGRGGPVLAVAVSPDGEEIVTGGDDGTARCGTGPRARSGWCWGAAPGGRGTFGFCGGCSPFFDPHPAGCGCGECPSEVDPTVEIHLRGAAGMLGSAIAAASGSAVVARGTSIASSPTGPGAARTGTPAKRRSGSSTRGTIPSSPPTLPTPGRWPPSLLRSSRALREL